MNFDSIVKSAYSWLSLDKVAWFVAFFWIALPFIIILPPLFSSDGVYSSITKPIAVILYDILYIAVVLGTILLIQHCLANNKPKHHELDLRKAVDLVFLVFVELFYVLVWNINAKLRSYQLLFLVASAALLYMFTISLNTIILILFAWVLLGYFALVVRSVITLFFSTSVFAVRNDISIKEAIKESHRMTNNRVPDTFASIIVAGFLAFILFAFVTLALGAVSSIILRYFLIDKLAVSMGFKLAMAFGLGVALIAYHFMIAEVYTQLSRHKEASASIKRILAHRVLHKKAPARRSFANKKKVVKKKRR